MAKRRAPVMKVEKANRDNNRDIVSRSKPQQKRRTAGKAIRPATDDPALMLGDLIEKARSKPPAKGQGIHRTKQDSERRGNVCGPLLPNPYQDEGFDDDFDDDGGPDE